MRALKPGKGDPASQVLPAGCGECRGEPWVIGDRGATRCACPRGQALKTMDQGRQPSAEIEDNRTRRPGIKRKRTAIAPERAWWWYGDLALPDRPLP